MDDGSVKYTGYNATTSYAQIPEGLESGVTDIAASSTTFAAVDGNGKVAIWGNVTNGENDVPEFEGEIREIYGEKSSPGEITISARQRCRIIWRKGKTAFRIFTSAIIRITP